jgi:hypothetical protein
MLQAKENFVRQGALIALSFVLIQHTASTCNNVVGFRKNIMKMITEKGEDTITKVRIYLTFQSKLERKNLVWRDHRSRHLGRRRSQCDSFTAQPRRTAGHAGLLGNICVLAALVLALHDTLHFAGFPPLMFDWAEQGFEGMVWIINLLVENAHLDAENRIPLPCEAFPFCLSTTIGREEEGRQWEGRDCSPFDHKQEEGSHDQEERRFRSGHFSLNYR